MAFIEFSLYLDPDPYWPLVRIYRRAKQRKLNNASESTLSSYGYLLIMISYLQSVDPPVLPVLNLLPLDWDGRDASHLEEGSEQLPNMRVPSADGRLCNVYFYQPEDEGALHAFGSRNTMGLGELFLGFFWHMSTQFDFQRSVVSIRTKDPFVLKDTKIKEDSWRRHRRLSVEDPFERYYDVAHPVREHKHRLIRAEMAVSLFAAKAPVRSRQTMTNPIPYPPATSSPRSQRIFALAANACETGVAPDSLLAEIMRERQIAEPAASSQPAGDSRSS